MPAIRTVNARSSNGKQSATDITEAPASIHPSTGTRPWPSLSRTGVRQITAEPDSSYKFPTGFQRVAYRLPDGSKPSASAWKIFDALQRIPTGCVVTYSELARAVGSHPRAILRWNPFAPAVPCHRVIEGNLYIGGYQGATRYDVGSDQPHSKLSRKLRLLEDEGVTFDEEGMLCDKTRVWTYA